MTWDEATIHMKEYGSLPTLAAADAYCNEIFTTDIENKVTTQMTRTLNAKYEKAEYVKLPLRARISRNKNSWNYHVYYIARYEHIFDGNLGQAMEYHASQA